MNKASVKFWNSFVSRFALFFTGLLMLVILLSGYLVYRKASAVITEGSQQQIKYSAELAEKSFYAMLAEVSNDIAAISTNPTLSNYINSPSSNTKSDLNHLLKITLEYKPLYYQIRLINNAGKEVIRFEKKESVGFNKVIKDIHELPETQLQDKGDRDYFKEAIQTKKGDLYFSRITLNEEYGEVNEPYIPTLQAASPLFDIHDQLAGLIIINVDLSRLYKTFDQISSSGNQLYLVDEQGQYLYSPNTYQQFGIQQNTNQRFQNDFNVSAESLPGTIETFGELKDTKGNRYLNYIKPFTYFKGIRQVYLITAIEENLLLKTAQHVRADSIQTLLWVCLFSLLLSYFFTLLFSKRINQITQAMVNYDEGNANNIHLPEGRKDEIGVLARTFNRMRLKIDQQVNDLNISLKKEKDAKQQRDEFLQNMSHEMRTPLNSILGLTQLLHKNSPGSAQLPIINSLERSANNLAGLVYDVLDHQKLIEGKVVIQQHPTNIKSLLEDIHANYQFEAVNKKLDFKLIIDKELSDQFYLTDPLRLSQIVVNLVVNAIKYTEKGKVTLMAHIITRDPSLLEIKVNDTGVGILDENLSKINDRFFREQDELSGRYGGYGLGLSIVRQLIALFGGELQAQSIKGEGSEFSIRIPAILSVSQTKEPSNFKEKKLPRLNNPYTILHIEDDLTTLELFQYILESSDIELIQTKNIDDISTLLNTKDPDLLISDLMLGEKKINTLLQEWIASKQINCPVIVTSAAEASVMKQISKFYFQKPFSPADLQDLTYRILGEQEYKAPDFTNIYASYDNRADKVIKVLKLLEDEFNTYLKRIEEVIERKDETEWDAIKHKVIVHINNLKLDELRKVMPVKIGDLTDQSLEKIKDTIYYYLCCFRSEQRLNSIN